MIFADPWWIYNVLQLCVMILNKIIYYIQQRSMMIHKKPQGTISWVQIRRAADLQRFIVWHCYCYISLFTLSPKANECRVTTSIDNYIVIKVSYKFNYSTTTIFYNISIFFKYHYLNCLKHIQSLTIRMGTYNRVGRIHKMCDLEKCVPRGID